MARDKLGGRPYEIKREGGKTKIMFFPQTSNAKNPDAVLFRIELSSDDVRKLKKILS